MTVLYVYWAFQSTRLLLTWFDSAHDGEVFPDKCPVNRSERSEEPENETKTGSRGHEHQPEPDDDEDFVVEQVDGKDTLYGISMLIAAHPSHPEVTERDVGEVNSSSEIRIS